MTIGEKIGMLRRKNGWSQETLAEKLSVSRQAVSLWERNESQPELEKLLTLARLFSVTTDYLLDDSAEEPAAPTAVSSEKADPPSSGRHRMQAFPFATFLNYAGFLVSVLLWKEYQRVFLLIPGILLQLLALTIALGCCWKLESPQKETARRRWLCHNLWGLLPLPLLWGCNFIFSLYPRPYMEDAPFLLALILYLVICPLWVRSLCRPANSSADSSKKDLHPPKKGL